MRNRSAFWLQFVVCGLILVINLGTKLPASRAADAIARSPQLPSTSPWNLEQLAEPPTFEWVDEKGPIRSMLYAGEPYLGKPTRVFAYYATPGSLAGDPSLDKQLPAMVLVHGGGGTAFREWAELWARAGYAAIAMDLAGYRPIEGKNAHDRANRERLAEGGPDQGDDEKFGSIDREAADQWPYQAVASAIRAHSLIRSFAEVDRERTAVTGISWGGYLTCILAGVDSRFKAAVPVYGCGFLNENSAWLSRLQKMSPEQQAKWVSLWDPSRYLPAVSMPILFVNGTNDFAYPLDSYMKSYAAVPGTKKLSITVNMPHGHPPGWAPVQIGRFVDQHLKGGAPLVDISPQEVTGSKTQVKLSGAAKIKQAAFHYTSDTLPINQRTWQTKPVSVEGESLTGEIPDDATAWFFTVTDEGDAVISSEVSIRK